METKKVKRKSLLNVLCNVEVAEFSWSMKVNPLAHAGSTSVNSTGANRRKGLVSVSPYICWKWCCRCLFCLSDFVSWPIFVRLGTCTVIMTFEICSVIVQAFCSAVCCAPLMGLGCCVVVLCVCVCCLFCFFHFRKDSAVTSLQNHLYIWCILSLYPAFRVCSERN